MSITQRELQRREQDRVNALGKRRLAEEATYDRMMRQPDVNSVDNIQASIARVAQQDPKAAIAVIDNYVNKGLMSPEQAGEVAEAYGLMGTEDIPAEMTSKQLVNFE
jgi:hypothetical protein